MIKVDARPDSSLSFKAADFSGVSMRGPGRYSGSPRVAAALLQLDRSQRTVLDWSFGLSGERLNLKRIGAELGVSEASARALCQTALRALYLPDRGEI